jgi:serine/threonine-protein kinase
MDDPTVTQPAGAARFGPYRVVAALGAGGMGVVYRARDERLERDVALKVLPPGFLSNETARERFRREARALSQLNHPHICTIYDAGEANGQIYIAMECIEGQPLSALIRNGALAAATVVRYALQVADAMDHAHDRGILHRDLKSSNIMVTPEGRIKVLDFGLAKRMGENSSAETAPEAGAHLTEAGALVGTIAYMAPEVLQGAPADARSDIWALGVILYEMASGALPFRGSSPIGAAPAILRETPAPLQAGVPAALQSVIERCLAKEPSQRYQRVCEVRAALETLQSGSSPVRPPPARFRKRGVRMVVAALVLAAIAVGLSVRRVQDRLTGGAARNRLDSVAVLPFQNLSHDSNEDYFTDGMTEEMITDLSKVRALRVISRPSVMGYKDTHKAPAAIAKELHVAALVVGSVLRSGDRVRISVQLIRADGEQNLWAESYERDMRDVLALQDEVARNIAGQVRVSLSPGEQASLAGARQVDPEVYRLYLQGRFYLDQHTKSSIYTAIQFFQQALEKDATYAPADAQLSFALSSLSSFYAAPKDVMPKAKAAAQRALELDDSLAEAHTALAFVLQNYEWDWPGAERELKRAIELNPSSSDAHYLYGEYLLNMLRKEEGIAEIEQAHQLDPFSLRVASDLAWALVWSRKYDLAIENGKQLIAGNPGFPWGYVWTGMAYSQLGRFPEAIAALKKADELEPDATMDHFLAVVQASAGNRAEARLLAAKLEEESKRGYVCAYEVAEIYGQLGQNDKAFQWMQRGVKEQCDCLVHLKSEPWLDPLRADPRYEELVKRVGFPITH